MKSYVKPALEVISVKTSENIADGNNIIKTVYTRAQQNYTFTSNTQAYNEDVDVNGSVQNA